MDLPQNNWGTGIDENGIQYHSWPIKRFRELFTTDKGFRVDDDVKAIIYSMGGPWPSEIESFEFKINPVSGEVRVYFVRFTDEKGKNPPDRS